MLSITCNLIKNSTQLSDAQKLDRWMAVYREILPLLPGSPSSSVKQQPSTFPTAPDPSSRTLVQSTFTAISTDFNIQGRCRRSGGLVVCDLSITNRGPAQHVFLHTDAKLFDKDSHAYPCDKTTLADNQSRGAYVMATLLHDLPARGSLQFSNVPPSVSAIYRLEFHISNGHSNPPPFVIDAMIPINS
jgi:hypothetical protein